MRKYSVLSISQPFNSLRSNIKKKKAHYCHGESMWKISLCRPIQPCSQKLVELWAPSRSAFELRHHSFCTAPSSKEATDDNPNKANVRYQDTPWDYMESEGLHIIAHRWAICCPCILPLLHQLIICFPRVHWALWDKTSVGRLQAEPQRRHTPTENPQDLHCKCFQAGYVVCM